MVESQWVIFKVSSIEQFIPDLPPSIHIVDGLGVASSDGRDDGPPAPRGQGRHVPQGSPRGMLLTDGESRCSRCVSSSKVGTSNASSGA